MASFPRRLAGFFRSWQLQPALSKTPQVYELMRRAIVSLAYPPRAVINEKLICERLEISRTPIREALLQLHAESLVNVVPNSGTYVILLHSVLGNAGITVWERLASRIGFLPRSRTVGAVEPARSASSKFARRASTRRSAICPVATSRMFPWRSGSRRDWRS